MEERRSIMCKQKLRTLGFRAFQEIIPRGRITENESASVISGCYLCLQSWLAQTVSEFYEIAANQVTAIQSYDSFPIINLFL